MHKYFAEWYRTAHITPQPEELKKRWKGIQPLINKAETEKGLELVRIYFDRPVTDSEFPDYFSQVVQKADPTFPMRDNELELKILAAASLAQIFETTNTRTTDILAYATVCCSLQGHRGEVLNSEIIRYADEYLIKESSRLREHKSSLTKAKIINLDKQLETLENTDVSVDAQELLPPLEKLFRDTVSVINTGITPAINNTIDTLKNELRFQREQSDILWWVSSEFSRDRNVRISDLQLPFAVLVVAKELADLTQIIPGPNSAQAFLDKMLRNINPKLSKKISLKDVINSADENWISKLISKQDTYNLKDLCPIHFGLLKSLEVEESDGWLNIFSKGTGLKSDTALLPTLISKQFYQERLLMNSLNE